MKFEKNFFQIIYNSKVVDVSTFLIIKRSCGIYGTPYMQTECQRRAERSCKSEVMEAPRGVLRENRRRDGDVGREKYLHRLFLPPSCDTCERISCPQPLHCRRHCVMIPSNDNRFLAWLNLLWHKLKIIRYKM